MGYFSNLQIEMEIAREDEWEDICRMYAEAEAAKATVSIDITPLNEDVCRGCGAPIGTGEGRYVCSTGTYCVSCGTKKNRCKGSPKRSQRNQ